MSEELNKNEEKAEEVEVDPFTQLMFGRPIRRAEQAREVENPAEKKIGEEYYALMEQIDSIMESVNKLKPMLKEFSPIIDYFKKKK